ADTAPPRAGRAANACYAPEVSSRTKSLGRPAGYCRIGGFAAGPGPGTAGQEGDRLPQIATVPGPCFAQGRTLVGLVQAVRFAYRTGGTGPLSGRRPLGTARPVLSAWQRSAELGSACG